MPEVIYEKFYIMFSASKSHLHISPEIPPRISKKCPKCNSGHNLGQFLGIWGGFLLKTGNSGHKKMPQT